MQLDAEGSSVSSVPVVGGASPGGARGGVVEASPPPKRDKRNLLPKTKPTEVHSLAPAFLRRCVADNLARLLHFRHAVPTSGTCIMPELLYLAAHEPALPCSVYRA